MVVSFIEVPAGNLMPTDRKDTPNSPPTSLPGALGDSRSVQLTSLSESDSGRGGMFLPLVHQGPSSLRRIRPASPGGRRRRRTWTCRLKAIGDGPDERADRALDHAGLRPARRRPWRIWRWRFKGLTGDDQTRCAGCGRRRKAVVGQPRRAFVGLTPPAGTERAPRRPVTPDGALIPAGVDLRQDGAPEGIEFPGAGAPSVPQFRFGALDGLVGSELGDKFGDRAAEGAL